MPRGKGMAYGKGSSSGGEVKRDTKMPSAGNYAHPGPLGLGAKPESTGKGGSKMHNSDGGGMKNSGGKGY